MQPSYLFNRSTHRAELCNAVNKTRYSFHSSCMEHCLSKAQPIGMDPSRAAIWFHLWAWFQGDPESVIRWCSTVLYASWVRNSLRPAWWYWEHKFKECPSMFLAHFLLWVSLGFIVWTLERIIENFTFYLPECLLWQTKKQRQHYLAMSYPPQSIFLVSLHYESSSAAKFGPFAVSLLLPVPCSLWEDSICNQRMTFPCVKK